MKKYPSFVLVTKHGDLMVTVHDKTPEKDSRGYESEIYPLSLSGLVKINGIEIDVNSSFKVYVQQGTNERYAHSTYGLKRAGTVFGADVTQAARETINKYAVKAYEQVTAEMWLEARRVKMHHQVDSLRSKADELRAESDKMNREADKLEAKIPM